MNPPDIDYEFCKRHGYTPNAKPNKANEIEQRFLEVAKESREHYRTTGLHVTHEEFGKWVDVLQTNTRATPPICHL